MNDSTSEISAQMLCDIIVKGMQEKKGTQIAIVDLQKLRQPVTDFFIICSGNTDRHVEAIADSVMNEVYKVNEENPWHIEGLENKQWVLLDYVNVVAHIFQKERRSFYGLEELWGDAQIKYIEDSYAENETF